MVKLEALVEYVDGYLGIPGHPDYKTALNGLQVAGPSDVQRIVASVDASEAVIQDAIAGEADFLLVHHGLFWDGLRPVTGRRHRKLNALLRNEIALYAAHLPLDGHPEVGNCALLAGELGMEIEGGFGRFQDVTIGWYGKPAEHGLADLVSRCETVLNGPVQLIAGGPEVVERVAVVTGGGGSFIEEAAEAGVDTLVTGEGSHHTFMDVHEMGINVLYGGHYATETFGVKALAKHLAEMFGLEWAFVDHPSGL